MADLIIILAAYMGAVISIGIYSFFKVKNASDYYISGKRGNWWQISGSLFATIMGGSAILGTIELSQKAGWPAIWFLLSAAAGLFILSIISRKVSIYGHYTLPELLLKFYGKPAEKSASIIIPIAWTGIVAAQIIAGAKILSSLGLMNYSHAALLCGGIFVFYTIAGGQFSILKTDFAQALIILSGIVTLIVFRIIYTQENSLMQNGISISGISSVLDSQQFKLFNEHFTPLDLFFLLLTYSVTFIVGPDIYSRIFCARNQFVAQKSVLLVAFLVIPVAFSVTWLGVSAGNNVVAGNGFILPGTAFLPTWALGLLAAALLSAVMSSADTTLLTSSMILTELFTGNLDKPRSYNITRIFIVLMGIISLLIALKVNSILNALLISLTFFSGAFVLPIIAGIAGWPVNKRNVMAAIITGGLLALSGRIINELTGDNWGYWLILAGYVANLSLLMLKPRKIVH
jgi:SSS family solute:Na+ symporter